MKERDTANAIHIQNMWVVAFQLGIFRHKLYTAARWNVGSYRNIGFYTFVLECR